MHASFILINLVASEVQGNLKKKGNSKVRSNLHFFLLEEKRSILFLFTLFRHFAKNRKEDTKRRQQ